MPTGRHVINNVPDNRLPEVVAGFIAQGASVTTIPEPDGEWTVIAVFPDNAAMAKKKKKAKKKKTTKKKKKTTRKKTS